MYKSRKTQKKSNFFRRIKKTTQRTLPVAKKGLERIGSTVQTVAKKSAPVVEKGVEAVYGTLAEGFDLGIKGVKAGVSTFKRKSRKHHTRRHHRH